MSMTVDRRTFAANPSYVEYERLLLALHRLYLLGREHSDEADAIRDGMDDAGELLSRAEIRRLKGISGDLFQIQGREIFVRVTDPDRASALLERLRQAANAGDWEIVLEILRERGPDAPDAAVARLRAMAFMHLGDLEAAQAFAEFAADLNPGDVAMKLLDIDLRAELGRVGEALVRARAFNISSARDLWWLCRWVQLLVSVGNSADRADWRQALDGILRALALAASDGERLSSELVHWATQGIELAYDALANGTAPQVPSATVDDLTTARISVQILRQIEEIASVSSLLESQPAAA